MRSIKSLLGSALMDETTLVNGRPTTLFDIVVMFFRELKARSEAFLGHTRRTPRCWGGRSTSWTTTCRATTWPRPRWSGRRVRRGSKPWPSSSNPSRPPSTSSAACA